MKRYIELEEITDGKLYGSNDLVRLGCNDCSGCSACCCNMEALVLDPYDIHQLKKGLDSSFEELLKSAAIIQNVDGLLLPVMNTEGEQQHCSFLNEEGRCSIHSFRPGICRLFPLGRYYHADTFSYILQVNECKKTLKTKKKVKSWLGIEKIRSYESYVLSWHHFLKEIQNQLPEIDPSYHKVLHMYLLNHFYKDSFHEEFYKEFEERLKKAKQELGLS